MDKLTSIFLGFFVSFIVFDEGIASASLHQNPPQKEPFSSSLVATGPYRAPANFVLVTSVTHPEGSIISHVDFSRIDTSEKN